MPKKRKRNSGKARRSGSGGGRIFKKIDGLLSNQNEARPTRAAFRIITGNNTTTSAFAEFELLPANMGARFVDFADVYTQWRPVALNAYDYVSMGHISAGGNQSVPMNHGLAYTQAPSDEYAIPTSTLNFIDFPLAHIVNEFHVARIATGKVKMHLNYKWLFTNNETLAQRSGGVITMLNSNFQTVDNASAQSVVIEVLCEFAGPIDPAQVPLLRKIRETERLSYGKGVVLSRHTPRPDSYVALSDKVEIIEAFQEEKKE